MSWLQPLWPLGQVLVTKLGLEQLDRQCYLRQREWQVYENAIRKRLIFQIRRLQRNKCTHWKEGARRKSTIYDVWTIAGCYGNKHFINFFDIEQTSGPMSITFKVGKHFPLIIATQFETCTTACSHTTGALPTAVRVNKSTPCQTPMDQWHGFSADWLRVDCSEKMFWFAWYRMKSPPHGERVVSSYR